MDKKTKRWIKIMNFAKCTGCHQRADRSFFYNEWQFPVCARCTGVIIGQALAFTAFIKGKRPIKSSLVFCSIMLGDWLVQFFKIKESTNLRRLFTGILGGFGLSIIYLSAIRKLFSLMRKSKI